MRRIFVHGFTQTAESWRPVLALVPAGDESAAIDVPTGLDFEATALAIGNAGGQGTYVGYSMGGRLCLRLAVERPELVEQLVLVSASPGVRDRLDRDRRRLVDEKRAQAIESDGVDAFLEQWLRMPLFRTLEGEARGMEARQRDAGILTHQLRVLGQGVMEPLWDRLGEVHVPVTIVVGARDGGFVGIGQEMRDAIPDARIEIIEGAGHALHLERPEALVRILPA